MYSKLDKVRCITLFVSGVVLFAMASIYSFYNFMPMSFWVKYKDVKPAKIKVNRGDFPYFKSTLDIKRPCSLSFNDIIRCKHPDNGYAWINSSITNITNAKKSNGYYESMWKYKFRTSEPGLCYLESHVTLKLPMGITKKQTINGKERGNFFEVIERVNKNEAN